MIANRATQFSTIAVGLIILSSIITTELVEDVSVCFTSAVTGPAV